MALMLHFSVFLALSTAPWRVLFHLLCPVLHSLYGSAQWHLKTALPSFFMDLQFGKIKRQRKRSTVSLHFSRQQLPLNWLFYNSHGTIQVGWNREKVVEQMGIHSSY